MAVPPLNLSFDYYMTLTGLREYQPPVLSSNQISCQSGQKLLTENNLHAFAEEARNLAAASSPCEDKTDVIENLSTSSLDLVTALRGNSQPAPVPRFQWQLDQFLDYAKIQRISFRVINDPMAPLITSTLVEQEANRTWKPRINMLETAASDRRIFSLSIVPRDPSVLQTWFFKRSVSPLIKPESKLAALDKSCVLFSYRERFYIERPSLRDIPHLMHGLVKPYPSFCSIKYCAEIDPVQLPADVTQFFLAKQEEIQDAIQDISPPDLREKVCTLLTDFLNDAHATDVALTLLQPSSGTVKKKLFTKLD